MYSHPPDPSIVRIYAYGDHAGEAAAAGRRSGCLESSQESGRPLQGSPSFQLSPEGSAPVAGRSGEARQPVSATVPPVPGAPGCRGGPE